MLTQFDFLRFILRNLDPLGTIGRLHLTDLGLVNPLNSLGNIISISTKETAATGFRRIFFENVSAIPIIDENNAIVETLSGSDFGWLEAETLKFLNLPVLEFKRKFNKDGKLGHAVTCGQHFSLAELILKLLVQMFIELGS